jgi:hypothetical protein
MQARFWLLGCATLLVSACDGIQGASSDPTDSFIKVLPEGVVVVAAPNQNLNAVRIDPADGCYVYRYAGPVETTFLPLRTVNGSPICTRPTEAPATS